jgi:hypothetical protein
MDHRKQIMGWPAADHQISGDRHWSHIGFETGSVNASGNKSDEFSLNNRIKHEGTKRGH